MNIKSIILEDPSGIRATITNYGATLMRLQVPDRNGKLVDVVIGLPKAEDYMLSSYHQKKFYLGATIGRYAGRISKGGFTLDNKFYPLVSEREEQLHGGPNSLDKQVWEVVSITEGANPSVVLKTHSPAGQNGYPATLEIFAKYQLSNNALHIEYTATTDAPTVINLTNHAYFNLNGTGSVANHILQLHSPSYLEVDSHLIPTGNYFETTGSQFDFRNPSKLEMLEQYPLDTPFSLKGEGPQAILHSEDSGITMTVSTNQPCMVLFTPHDLGNIPVRNAHQYKRFPAICLECQNFPDAPNQPNFPSSVLFPGTTYRNTISYNFT